MISPKFSLTTYIQSIAKYKHTVKYVQVNTKRGGSSPFGVYLFLPPDANMYPVINAKTFLPVIDVALLMLNAAFKVVERLHQDQGQFSCQRNWSSYA